MPNIPHFEQSFHSVMLTEGLIWRYTLVELLLSVNPPFWTGIKINLCHIKFRWHCFACSPSSSIRNSELSHSQICTMIEFITCDYRCAHEWMPHFSLRLYTRSSPIANCMCLRCVCVCAFVWWIRAFKCNSQLLPKLHGNLNGIAASHAQQWCGRERENKRNENMMR